MQKIDFSKSLGGELYPIVASSVSMGQLGFVNERKPQFVPNLETWVLPLAVRKGARFFWTITPLNSKKAVISCKDPKSGVSYMLGHGLMGNQTEIFVEDRDIPEYCEQVLVRNQFEFEYIAGSPLFFHLQSCLQLFVSAGIDKSMRPDPSFLVLCFLNENSKKYEYFQDYCSWYLAMNDATTGPNALKGFSNLKPFSALSTKFKVQIDEPFLKKLTGN